MAVVIRLSRQGAKNAPDYLIVVTDQKKRRDGGYLAKIGQYKPKAKDPKAKIKINTDAFNLWRSKGAQVSETVGQLVKSLSK